MKLTLDQANKMMRDSVGDLDLSGTSITSLPSGLFVAGRIYR